MQQLQPNTLLQGGKYKIIKALGQGGFGITYLAIQSGLERKVAIKEFFMKELCSRDGSTSRVTIGTEGSRETISRFREKFLKEARNIARLDHPNIVGVIDVFEENGTAYYVMKYAENGSLADKVKKEGCLPEPIATRYIIQIASALEYIHKQKMNHLDVKPANIMLNEKDEAVLIDFGLSKQYDATTGNQTSTTPVGISEGYAPMEQYMQGGVGIFSPETDVYALGATFFKLLTGMTPPDASFINNNGVPVEELRAKGLSQTVIDVICKAMESRKKDRLHDISSFMKLLGSQGSTIAEKTKPMPTDDDTLLRGKPQPKPAPEPKPQPIPKNRRKLILSLAISVLVVAVAAIIVGNINSTSDSSNEIELTLPQDQSPTQLQEISSQTYTANGVSFEMMKVEGGTFTMGATSEMEDPYDEEKPTHQVTLSSYYIGQTEVTQALWKAVMGSNPSYFKGDNLPVECVSCDDCQDFISKLNSLTGRHFRLPTEAEWEFAARGGNDSNHTQYSGSSNIDNVAWYYDNSGRKTHPVATKQANELGIYDMSGNVGEWCSDCYDDYNSASQTNPTGPASGYIRVCRGGSWNCHVGAGSFRVSCRDRLRPFGRINSLGLRLCLSE